jgi:hypothetical protein
VFDGIVGIRAVVGRLVTALGQSLEEELDVLEDLGRHLETAERSLEIVERSLGAVEQSPEAVGQSPGAVEQSSEVVVERGPGAVERSFAEGFGFLEERGGYHEGLVVKSTLAWAELGCQCGRRDHNFATKRHWAPV